jgi:hypothetical protein
MPQIPQLALAASIVASVTGALVMCALVFRYGFTIPAAVDSEDGPTPGDVLVTRVGHAVAGACFAATAVLAIVGLAGRAADRPVPATVAIVPPAVPVSMATEVAPAPPALPSVSADEVKALEARLAAAEAKLARVERALRAKATAPPLPVVAAPPPPTVTAPQPPTEQTVLRHFGDVRSRLTTRD